MKHKSLTALIALLVFSLAMTLISVKNYVSSLNTVSVLDTSAGNLRTESTVTGFLHFVSTLTIPLPEGCGIDEVLVSPGDEVRVGQPLLRFHYDDLLLCRLQLLLSREQLQDRPGASAVEKEIAALQVKAINEQLETIEELIAAEGSLNSPVRAQVTGLPPAGGAIELGLYDDGLYCSWEIPQSDYRELLTFSSMISKSEEALAIDKVSYQPAKAIYQYRSKPFSVTGLIDTTIPVEINVVYVSRDYRAVLPKRCIRKDSDGSLFVYMVEERATIYGTERYLYKTGVTILEQNDEYVAVMTSLSNVVEYALNTPVNLEAVRVIE